MKKTYRPHPWTKDEFLRFYGIETPQLYFDLFQMNGIALVKHRRYFRWELYGDAGVFSQLHLTSHITEPDTSCLENIAICARIQMREMLPTEARNICGVFVYKDVESRDAYYEVNREPRRLGFEDAVARVVEIANLTGENK